MHASINKTNLVYREKVSGFIFNKNNELLIIQKPDYGDVHWDFPGGGIEAGETPEQALMRELKEELGNGKFKVVEKSDIVNQYEYPDFVIEKELQKGKNHRGQRVLQFIVKFVGSDSDIKLQESEIKKYKWVSFADLKPHMNFEGQWENAKEVIENSIIHKTDAKH